MSAATATEIAPPELYIPRDLIRRQALGPFCGPYTTPDRIAEAKILAASRTAIDSPSYARWVGYYLAMIHRAEGFNIPTGIAIDHIYLGDDHRAGLTAMLLGSLLIRNEFVWTTPIYTDQHVKMVFKRPGGRKVLGTYGWTITQAAVAKLTVRHSWRTYPKQCLRARTISEAFRDLVGVGGYTWDEIRNNDVDADYDTTAELPPRVIELLDQAQAPDASSEHIRRALMKAVKTEQLGGTHVGHGKDLDQAMHEAWLAAAAREALAETDAALAATGPDPLAGDPIGPRPDDVEHAAAGELDCGCDAALHARTGQHSRPDCALALARWSG